MEKIYIRRKGVTSSTSQSKKSCDSDLIGTIYSLFIHHDIRIENEDYLTMKEQGYLRRKRSIRPTPQTRRDMKTFLIRTLYGIGAHFYLHRNHYETSKNYKYKPKISHNTQFTSKDDWGLLQVRFPPLSSCFPREKTPPIIIKIDRVSVIEPNFIFTFINDLYIIFVMITTMLGQTLRVSTQLRFY